MSGIISQNHAHFNFIWVCAQLSVQYYHYKKYAIKVLFANIHCGAGMANRDTHIIQEFLWE